MPIREASFDKVNLERFVSSNEKILKLINDPFYENEPDYFVNKDWISVEIANDFFIEEHSFPIFQKLMELNEENYILLTYACPFKETPYYKIPIDADIETIRQFMNDGSHWTTDWYFVSPSMKWAAISVYDDSALYIGYESEYKLVLNTLIMSNPDFVKFL